MKGDIYNVRCFNTVLTEDEIEDLTKAPKPFRLYLNDDFSKGIEVPKDSTFWVRDDMEEREIFRIVYPYIKTKRVVEWKTVSRTTPVCDMSGCLAVRHDTCNQIGTEYEVKYVEVVYKGEPKEFELERIKIDSEKLLERTIACNEKEELT